MSQDRRTFDLSAPKIFAGALAAASAAVASSWLGVAGTVLGAVVVSVVASVGTALYTAPLERSTRIVRETLPPRLVRDGGVGDTRVGSVTGDTAAFPAAAPGSEPAPSDPGVPGRRRIRWASVAVTSVAMLSLGFSMLTAFESLVGEPASSLTGSDGDGGTTITRIVAPGDAGKTPDQANPTPGQSTSDSGPTGSGGTATSVPGGQTTSAPTAPDPTTSDPTTSVPTSSSPTTAEPTPSGATSR